MFLTNHKSVFMVLVWCLALVSVISCSEQDEVDDFSNWKNRNITFIDSIAQVAQKNTDGKWLKIKAFNLGDSTSLYDKVNQYFVYVHKLEEGNGTECPLYNDSVRVHYCGRLIRSDQYPEGCVFGKSYSSTILNEATDVPSLMGVNQSNEGFATALMNMREGDRWMVYIPYYLGYGEKDNSIIKIPGYSSLIFDVKLAKIYKYGKDKNTAWY